MIHYYNYIIELNWQKTRYVYDMYYTYHKISKDVYNYCVINKIIDNGLITKWKKPGYERLCSTYVINPCNYKFGTVSICRVPKQFLAPNTEIEDPTTGCRGCASGNNSNIFNNKYGQYLAGIQIAREEKLKLKNNLNNFKNNNDDHNDDEDEDEDDDHDHDEDEDNNDDHDLGPVGAPDGSSGPKKHIVWATNDHESEVELTIEMIGELGPEAKREAMLAASKLGSFTTNSTNSNSSGPPGKRTRNNL